MGVILRWMNIGEWLKTATKRLTAAGIGSAQLDALIMMEDELGKTRAHLLAHPEIELSPASQKVLESKLKRRLRHEPMAYIRGFSEFYGRRFTINKDVLEPRPESETMIELLVKLNLPDSALIADIGTGSGALAITVKLQQPTARVVATEIDPKALKVATKNATDLGAKIDFFEGNLLEPIKHQPNAILANLPYVPDKWQINEAAAMEPRIAIFGGNDGLDLYRQMFGQLKALDWRPKFIFTECLPPQHEALAKIASQHSFEPTQSHDFIQVFEPIKN